MSSTDFQIDLPQQVVPGVAAREVGYTGANGPAVGRVVCIDTQAVTLEIYVFYELVNRNFNPKWGYSPPPNENFGITLLQLLSRTKSEASRIHDSEIKAILFACNATHTNFVRGNGFVISKRTLVYKPAGAIPLDGDCYRPLHGGYTALCLSPGKPRIRDLLIKGNSFVDEELPEFAISGPAIVESGRNVSSTVPVRLKTLGQTLRNEVNYSPMTERASFTAFGVTGEGQLICASMFAGNNIYEDQSCRLFKAEQGKGVTLSEMADLLIALGATEGITGGGSADTQQFVKGFGIWASLPRDQPGRPQVGGEDPISKVRGLGAVLSISCNR